MVPALPDIAGVSDAQDRPRDGRRYPGIRSFEERDQLRFFGRSRATEELLLRVLSVRLLLQFAPSGAGKTSLLNAGLFPRLRPHGYLPFTVRLNNTRETVLEAVARSLRLAAQETGLHKPVVPAQATSIWELLAGTQLWTPDLLLLTPVLVFDQFEEVFTLRDEAFRGEVARELGALTRTRRASGPNGPTDVPPPDAKIIISLREEYLGLLEDMTSEIPDLFRERLRVPPLTPDEAREAIVAPAALEGDWTSPRFTFSPECLDGLVNFIDGVSERVRVIEPLTLQLVCQRAEAIARERQETERDRPLTLADFGGSAGLERLVLDYYTTALDRLGDPGTRRRAVRLFEEGLLDPSGKRLMLEQGEITRTYGLDANALVTLVENRLLRREPRNESVFYEISHDRLTDVIARHRTYRLPRWVLPTLAVAALAAVLFGGLALFARLQWRAAEDARRKTSAAMQLLFGDELMGRLRDAGLSDALQTILAGAAVNADDPRSAALHQRRLGELAWERGTLALAEDAFTKAAETLDRVAGPEDAALSSERGAVMKSLGDIALDRGRVTEAESHYDKAVEHLLRAASGPLATSASQMSEAEARIAAGVLRDRLGDPTRAEAEYRAAAAQALDLLLAAYSRVQEGTSENTFELGRALQIYADATLGLAKMTWDFDEIRAARALAAELQQSRPMSAQARTALGVASVYYAQVALDNNQIGQAQLLFEESARQFAELTTSDQANRRMQREREAVRLVTAQSLAKCATQPSCRKELRPEQLHWARTTAVDVLGELERASAVNTESTSLVSDLAWALETQAAAARSSGAHELALQLLDRARERRTSAAVDDRDGEAHATIVDTMYAKAEALADIGKHDAALQLTEEALVATTKLPGAWQTSRRWDGLRRKTHLLTNRGRTDEAKRLELEIEQLQTSLSEVNGARQDRWRKLNDDANEIYGRASAQSGKEARALADQAIAKYRLAIGDAPLNQTIWGNLRNACALAAGTYTSDGAGVGTEPLAKEHESALRCELVSSWMLWVLSNDLNADAAELRTARSASLRRLYEARRDFAMALRNADPKRALTLAERNVREAELFAVQNGQTADALWMQGDAYFGMAMLRQESDSAGWDPAFRAALAYGERLQTIEPKAAERQRWLGMVRNELANRFANAGRQGEATGERLIARGHCQSALKLARTEADRTAAKDCLSAATSAP